MGNSCNAGGESKESEFILRVKQQNVTKEEISKVEKIQTQVRGLHARKSIENKITDAVNEFHLQLPQVGKFIDDEEMNNRINSVVKEVHSGEKPLQLEPYRSQVLGQLNLSKSLSSNNEEKDVRTFNGIKIIGKSIIETPPILFHDNSIYKGTWNLNFKKEGNGTFVKADGSLYIGNFHEDQIEGYGRYIDINGNIYEGGWKNGKANGFGRMTHQQHTGYSYEGDFLDDSQHGNGREVLPNGAIYTGAFDHGERHGEGKMEYPDGSTYEGSFINSNITGHGKYTWPDGRVYTGEFKENKIHGLGKTQWTDGSYYEGEYKNDHKDGIGKFVWNEDKYYEGNFLNNLFHGKGKFVDKRENSEYEGIWRFGKNVSKKNKEESVNNHVLQ